MAKMYGKGKTAIESEEQVKLRWQVELEFVQCLANPNYLNFLAQRGYFKDQAFINYLKYLQYWKEPEYAKYLMYPMCLYFLDMLQFEHFRREIVNSQCAKFIDDQIILMWQHYTRKRIKLINAPNGESSTNVDYNSSVMPLVRPNHIGLVNNLTHNNNPEYVNQFNMNPQQQQQQQFYPTQFNQLQPFSQHHQQFNQELTTPQQLGLHNGIGSGASGSSPFSPLQYQQNPLTPMSSHNGSSGNGNYSISSNNNIAALLHRT